MQQLFVDGGVIKQNPSPFGGTWAWCLVEDGEKVEGRSGVILPEDLGTKKKVVTNNQTELLAAVQGLSALPLTWAGTLFTDSKVTLHRLLGSPSFNGIPQWLVRKTLELRRNRKWTATLVKGHPTRIEAENGRTKRGTLVSPWNKWCDDECKRLAKNFLANGGK